jgi:hypothetical protein
MPVRVDVEKWSSQESGRGLIRIEQPGEGTFGEGGSAKSGSDEERPKFATRDRA